tara:strand:- start:22938 stop:26720 length:3783 start_codon:yes stop_codon:yes gene_type:complete
MKLTDSYPTKEAQAKLIEFTAKQIETAMQDSSVAVRHNAFTDYCLALIFCCTGHRPVVDPIHSRKLFDLKLGWMLIADKVVHEERSWRLVALPPIACQQIQNYLDYLPRLAAWLDQNPVTFPLRNQITELLGGTDSIPFFFYMDEEKLGKVLSITPSLIAKRWEEYWKLPINFLRHMAATELRRYSGQAYWAQIQLGHFSGSEHPFGVTATQSAQHTLSNISIQLEQFMQDMGWQALKSLIRLPHGVKAVEIAHHSQLKSSPFGNTKRKQQRQKKRTIMKSYIRSALDVTLQGQTLLNSVDQIQQAARHIITHTPISLTNPCLRMFYRYVARLPNGKTLLKQSAPARIFSIEPSPFNENSLLLYQYTEQLRQNFQQYLNDSYQPEIIVNPALRVAEIMVCAALFGGIADPKKLEKISTALYSSTYHYDNKLFIELPFTANLQGPVFRWFPDIISHMLIQRYYQHDKSSIVSDKQLRSTLITLLEKLGLEAPQDSVQLLARAAHAAVILEAPGHTAKFLSGELNSVSVPLSQWVRIHSGKALSTTIESNTVNSQARAQAPLTIGQSSMQKNSHVQNKDFLKLLRRFFNSAYDMSAIGNINTSTNRKRELARLIRDQFGSTQANWSSQMLSIAAWAIHLCEHGTRTKKNLAFKTVDKYVFMVSRALLQAEVKEHFLALDADTYEDLYLSILEVELAHRQHDIAGRLLEFHHFLVSAYAVEEPSWSAIFKAVGQDKALNFADANFVSEDEYFGILEAINNSPHLHPITRNQYITLLFLGYRFGLRFGEAYRLQYRDIQLDSEAIYLCIRNNIFGEVKSASGQRVVTLLEKINQLEHEAFDQLIGWAEIQWHTDKQAALMGEPQMPRTLINRTVAASEIGQFIKLVTGDNSLRFHHLRHSWATRLYVYSYTSQKDGSGSLGSTSIIPERWDELIGSHATNYPLTSIATAIGHLSETTTIEYYIHAIDVSFLPNDPSEKLHMSSRAYGYALGISQENARQRAVRGRILSINKKVQKPDVKLQDRLEKIDVSRIKILDTRLSLMGIEQLLSRRRDTKQSILKVAAQLFIEPNLATRIASVATHAERQSGVDYYQLEHSDSEDLLITDEQRQQLAEQQANPKIFQLQNRNVLSILRSYSNQLEDMPVAELYRLKEAFVTWRQTLKYDVNIVSDKQELANIQYIKDTLLDKLQITISLENESSENTVKTTKLFEKTAARKLSGTLVKLHTDKQFNTRGMLNRILLILSIFLELKVSHSETLTNDTVKL